MLTTIIVAIVAALLVVAALAIARARRPAPPARVEVPEPGPLAPLEGVAPVPGPVEHGPPLPVVLVHGLFGFDRIGLPGVQLDYFRGIGRQLEALGCRAHAVRLPGAASVPERARALAQAIAALPHARVDVIAHSLGGLDARYALTHLGLAARVRALVTVGTPHRGTPLADLAVGGALDLPRRLVRALGVPLDALEWLSTAALARFNDQVVDVPGVRYACVVGGMHRPDSPVPLALAPAHAYLRRVAGANDGLVPISSQYWGETFAEIEADHFAQIGWQVAVRRGFDARGLYAFVVARLGDAPAHAPRAADAAYGDVRTDVGAAAPD